MGKTKKSAVKDLTVGSPLKLIIEFAFPLFCGMLFQQFYNLVDTLIVGRFLGPLALAGVGSTGAINFMIIGFCMGVCNGFAIPISQRFGAGDYSSMRKFFSHSIYLSAVFAIVMTVIVGIFCKQILIAMQTPSDIMEYAYNYIIIIFIGIPTTYLYNLFSAAIRALGDSKAPVVFLVISSIINIVLDLIFIVNFDMGVTGASLATVISQGVSGIIAILYIVKKVELLHIKKREWEIDLHYFGILCKMGLPMGLQYSITAIGSVVLQTAVNSLGSTYVAAMAAGGKVLIFFECPFDALGSTMATYGGQNVGAAKPERLNKGLFAASAIGIIYSLIAFVILYLFGDVFTGFFLENDVELRNEIVASGRLYLIICSAFFVFLTFVNCVRFMIQGMGYSMLAIFAGVMEMVGRVLVAFVMVPKIGFMGACFASPIAWIFADLFLIPAYFYVRKKVYDMLKKK